MFVALINPPLVNTIETDSLSYPPLGILSLSSFLKLHGHEVLVLDLAMTSLSFQEMGFIFEDRVEVIGITVYTEILGYVQELVSYLKKKYPEAKIILGGPHSSALPLETLEMTGAHVVVSKEGEAAFIELVALFEGMEGMNLQDIPGIYYQEGGRIKGTGSRGYLEHLNLLPFPDRHEVEISLYHDPFSIISSRGCAGRCVFCATQSVNGSKYRTRDYKHIFGEVVYLNHVFGARIISFLEDTFTADKERLYSFVSLIKRSGLEMQFRCESRIDQVNQEMLLTMKEIGFTCIQYGIETGDERVMKAIRKDVDLGVAEEIICYTRDLGIIPKLSFCLGHYADTKESLAKTVAFIKRLVTRYKAHVSVSFNTPFPGTYQYNHLEELGIYLTTRDFSEFTLMQPLTYTDHYTIKDLYRIHFQILAILLTQEQDHVKEKRGVRSDEAKLEAPCISKIDY